MGRTEEEAEASILLYEALHRMALLFVGAEKSTMLMAYVRLLNVIASINLKLAFNFCI